MKEKIFVMPDTELSELLARQQLAGPAYLLNVMKGIGFQMKGYNHRAAVVKSTSGMIVGVFLICSLLLSACTSYNETFDCEPGRGVGCKSLGEVNRMVDRGDFIDVQEEESFASVPPIETSSGLHIWMAPEGQASC